LALKKGDVLVMYTDGVTEAANKKGVRFGVPRLKKLITAQHRSSATKMVAAICDAVKEYVGEGKSPADDVTVVVVKVI
jgi:phosphoserine phosphatase RsbU/P